jgi:lipid-binding SYLF domain-containing protein
MGLNSPIPVKLPEECKKASKIIRSFVDSSNNGLDKIIPRSVLERAQGFAVFTVVKAGFLFSARGGSGIVIAKLDDGSWSAPSAIGTAGFGFGGQMGAEVTDFLIVLNSRTAVKTFMAAGSMTLGGNLSVAVGPLGRNAEGSGTLNSKGKAAALYSYSKTKGLFGGVSIEGSIIVERQDANRQAYGQDFTSKELLSGVVPPPPWAHELIETLQTNIGMPGGRTWIDDHPDELGRDEDEGLGRAGEGGERDRRSAAPYAFGEPNVASFSSASTPQRPKPRSRASTLSSVFKMDLMGNQIPGLSGGVGFPRKRSSGPDSPSFSRRTDRTEPKSPFDDDDERKYSRQNEYNPFDDALTPRHTGLDDDMDLSREIISPWNNDKGLPSPQSKYKSDLQTGSPARGQLEFKEEYRSPNRSRASTLQNSDMPSSRPRSGSNALRVSSPLTKYNYQDSAQESDQVESSLAGQMSRLRAGSNASNKMSRFGKSGYSTPPINDFDDDERFQQSDKDYDYPISPAPAPAMPRSSSSKLLSFVNRKRSNTANSRGGTDFVVDPAIHQADRNIVLGTLQSARFGDFDQPADLDPMYGAGTKPTADQLSFAVKKDLADAMKDGRERALAIHDYEGQEEGDLSMRQGDVIIITERSESQDDW